MKKNKVLIKKVEFDFDIGRKNYDSAIFNFLSKITKYDFDKIFKSILSKDEFKNFNEDIFIEKLEIDLNDIYLVDLPNISSLIKSQIEMELLNYLNLNSKKIISKSVDDFLDEYFSQKILPWWFSPKEDFKNIILSKKLDIRDSKKVFKLIVRDYNFFKKIFNPFSEEEINILLKDILGEKFKIYSKVLEFKKKIFEIFPELKSEDKNYKSIIFSSIRYTNLYSNDNSIYNRVIQSEIFSNYNRLDLITEKYNQFTKLTDYHLDFVLSAFDKIEKDKTKIHRVDNNSITEKTTKRSSVGKHIDDFQKSDNRQFKGKSKEIIKIKKALFDSISEYFKVFSFYKKIDYFGNEVDLLFEIDTKKFSRKFNNKDQISSLLTDLDLFNEFINLYENDEEKLISFSAMTLKEEYEELVKGFLAKFSTEIYQSESKFFEFQKKIDFKIPDDFCKLFLRYNLIKLISLNPDLEFNRLDYYYDILFQIISSSEVKNISGLKKSLPKNELDVDLKKIVAAINNPYPYYKTSQAERDSIFFKDLYFHHISRQDIETWSNIEMISEREVIGFLRVLVNKNDVSYLKIIFNNIDILSSRIKELIEYDSNIFINIFHLLNDSIINLNDESFSKIFKDNSFKNIFLFELFRKKLWKSKSYILLDYELHKVLRQFGLTKSMKIGLKEGIKKKIEDKAVNSYTAKKTLLVKSIAYNDINEVSKFFVNLSKKSTNEFIHEFFNYAINKDFLNIPRLDFLLNKIREYFKTNKNELDFLINNPKDFTKNQILIYKIFDFKDIVSILNLRFKTNEDKILLKAIFEFSHNKGRRNFLKFINTLKFLMDNIEISKFEIIHLVFLEKKFRPKYFVNLFNEVLLNDIDFSDLEKSKNITRLSFKVNEKKKNQLEFFQKILKQDYKDSLNHEISKNIIVKHKDSLIKYKDSLIQDLTESNFHIFSYYIEFGSFPHDSKIHTLKTLKNYFDATVSSDIFLVKKYLYNWSKSQSKIDRFLNIIFLNPKDQDFSSREFENLFRLIYPNLYKYLDLIIKVFSHAELLNENSFLNLNIINVNSLSQSSFELKKSIIKKFLSSWSIYRFIVKDPLEYLAETIFSDISHFNNVIEKDMVFSSIKKLVLGEHDNMLITNFIKKINSKIEKPTLEKHNDLEKKIDEIKDGIIIYNAGLLLFWPFFKTLFIKLNLLKSDKKSYKDEISMDKAVLATDFLVNGTNSKEKDFIFNKILCGVDINKEIDVDLQLSDFEIEICKNAIQALLSNWTKVKSAQTLRDWFLNREGRLIEKEDSFVIDIENKPPDIFLKSIPWGISIVNYDLMEKKLIVNWKH